MGLTLVFTGYDSLTALTKDSVGEGFFEGADQWQSACGALLLVVNAIGGYCSGQQSSSARQRGAGTL
jgi:hypothetical protein